MLLSSLSLGNALAAAGFVTYLGAFPDALRRDALADWSAALKARGLGLEEGFSLRGLCSQVLDLEAWLAADLPNDPVAVENAIIISMSKRVPLCVDPHGQANRWLKSMEEGNGLEIVSAAIPSYGQELETLIKSRRPSGGGDAQPALPVLLEDLGQELDPRLISLLDRHARHARRARPEGAAEDQQLGAAGDAHVRLFITSVLRMPSYSPEVCSLVTTVDFTISAEGLGDQLLAVLLHHLEPEAATWRLKSVSNALRRRAELRDLEDNLLRQLAADPGKILMDSAALDVVDEIRANYAAIADRQAAAEVAGRERMEQLVDYKVAALGAGAAFESLWRLGAASPTNHFSLPFFLRLFEKTCEEVAKRGAAFNRHQQVAQALLRRLYVAACRSLFCSDRTLLAVLLALDVGRSSLPEGEWAVTAEEYRFLLGGLGGVDLDDAAMGTMPADWPGGAHSWARAIRLSRLPGFEGLLEALREHAEEWQQIRSADDPHKRPFPGACAALTRFRKLLVLQLLGPERALPALHDWVCGVLGKGHII